MLVEFNVYNFLSFSNLESTEYQTFSMKPAKVRLHPEHVYHNRNQNLLKFAAIYGSNASGKSNLVKALDFFKKTTIKGKCPVGSIEKYCKLNQENINKPSCFECKLLIDNELYSYGFEIILSKGILQTEWLKHFSKNNTSYLFYKENENADYHFSSIFRNNSALKVYQQGIKGSNTLFLYEMNNNKQGFYQINPEFVIMQSVYNWIKYQLEIVSPSSPAGTSTFLLNSTSLNQVADLLNAFGTGVVSIVKVPEDPEKIFDNMPMVLKRTLIKHIESFTARINQTTETHNTLEKWTSLIRNKTDIICFEIDRDLMPKAYSIQFKHQNISSNIPFKISEESDGTIRLFELLEILLSRKDKTYIVDELDRCFHPCLSYEFIKRFFEYKKNNSKTQLIVTTHESRLLDFNLLRRDEIWFVNKENSGDSKIHSLEDFNPRFDLKIDKAYMDGQFGGIPLFAKKTESQSVNGKDN